MSINCMIGLHKWHGCICCKCGKTRDEQHDWSKDCEKCSTCGKTRNEQHKWNGCKCSVCSTEQHNWSKDIEQCCECKVVRKSGTFIDERDKHEYKWVRIGNQIWMAENLAHKWGVNSHEHDKSNIYGFLYDWETSKLVVPKGWHLPSIEEWEVLERYLDAKKKISGEKMKEIGTAHWPNPVPGVTNESGFKALPGGEYLTNGHFQSIGSEGFWWSSSEFKPYPYLYDAWYVSLHWNRSDLKISHCGQDIGLSVRCVLD